MMGIIVYHFHITYMSPISWLLKVKDGYFRGAIQQTEREPDKAPAMGVSSTSIDLREILLDN